MVSLGFSLDFVSLVFSLVFPACVLLRLSVSLVGLFRLLVFACFRVSRGLFRLFLLFVRVLLFRLGFVLRSCYSLVLFLFRLGVCRLDLFACGFVPPMLLFACCFRLCIFSFGIVSRVCFACLF